MSSRKRKAAPHEEQDAEAVAAEEDAAEELERALAMLAAKGDL